jgi:hypothetical protein
MEPHNNEWIGYVFLFAIWLAIVLTLTLTKWFGYLQNQILIIIIIFSVIIARVLEFLSLIFYVGMTGD